MARTNIPAGNPTFQTLSTNAIEPPPFVTYNLPVPSGYLVFRTNMLAVQVFNTGLNSSDLGFDALLDVTISEITPPVILNITPTPAPRVHIDFGNGDIFRTGDWRSSG